MEEVKSGKAKTLTFLVLGVIVVFIGWFILGKFIPSVSFENMFVLMTFYNKFDTINLGGYVYG